MKFRPLSQTRYVWMILVLLAIIAIVLKSTYRHYVYANQIKDFGIADASPNFFAGLIIVFFYFTQYQKSSLKMHAIFAVTGLVGYELIQGSVFKNNFFDYKDIIASVLGVVIGCLICFAFRSGPVFSDPKVKGSHS